MTARVDTMIGVRDCECAEPTPGRHTRGGRRWCYECGGYEVLTTGGLQTPHDGSSPQPQPVHGPSPQPVTGRIVAHLDELAPAWATYRDLAANAYATDEPSAAQLSAVRRAVAKLVAEGRAERGGRAWGGDGQHLRTRTNRLGYTGQQWYANPGGTIIRRPLTAEEQGAEERRHAATMAKAFEAMKRSPA